MNGLFAWGALSLHKKGQLKMMIKKKDKHLYDSMSYRSNLYSLMEIRKTNTFSFAKCRILFLKIKIT